MRLTGPGSVLDRVLGLRLVVIVRRTLEVYGFGGGLLAAGLAYRSLFALLSASLLIAGIVGFYLVRDPQRQAEIISAVGQRFPPIAPLLQTGLDRIASGAVQFSIIGLAGLAWGVSGVYGTLDIAIARVFGHESGRGFAIRTVRGLVLVAILIVGIVFAAAATTLSITWDFLSGPGTPGSLQAVVGLVSPIVTVAVYVAMVGLIYRFVPPVAPSWRALGVPAVAMGIAFAVFNTVFVRLQSYLLGSFQLFSAFAVVLATMIWLSFGFQILLIGASWIRAREEGSSGETVPPAMAAPPPPMGEEESVRR